MTAQILVHDGISASDNPEDLESAKADCQELADSYQKHFFVFTLEVQGKQVLCMGDAESAAREEKDNPRFRDYRWAARPTRVEPKLTPKQKRKIAIIYG